MEDAICRTVSLKAPVERVWRAISDAGEFGHWFGVVLEGPFRQGEAATGRITHPGYEHIRWEAQVVAVEPPHRFAFTWHPYAIDPAIDYSGEPPTLVEFRLAPDGTGTRLTITESGFAALPAHRREEAMRMNAGGWDAQIGNVRDHVGG